MQSSAELSNAWQPCENKTGTIKFIAIICMIIDHAGVVFFPQYTEFRIIGRIAFPLYAWCLVIGSEHTHSLTRYMIRILLMLLISQPFYMLALQHDLFELNIFATLFLGLFGIMGIKLKRGLSQIWMPLLAVLAACCIKIDYGWKGVAFILLLYPARKNRGTLAAIMIAFCLFWGQGTILVKTLFSLSLNDLFNLTPYGESLVNSALKLQTAALLALPVMLIRYKREIRLPRYIAYAAYPAHLAIIYIITLLMK